jgi:2-polyprenyl-3-methyl-5-hydroxy-6-metoxy-1,4-benzoquinol methylase
MAEVREIRDMRAHWIEWRADWERKIALNEIQFLRSVADLQGAFQHRSTLMESNFREMVKAQHADYLGAIDRARIDIQQRLWADLQQIRLEYDRLIHTELRLIRQRSPIVAAPVAKPEITALPATADFDYGRFAERFRGPEDYVRTNIDFYKPFFASCENVLDIGCGRGEFLGSMRDIGVGARGIDLSEESVAQCRQSGLEAERADLFVYLAAQPEDEFDGIFSSQVVEHLDPGKLPEMIRLCATRLRRGALLAIETPNPECLAIFATHFYLDPTHTRPVPHPLLAFYMEEAGLGQIEVHQLSPAIESMPEIAELPLNFRERFFGGLDYAIIGRRL